MIKSLPGPLRLALLLLLSLATFADSLRVTYVEREVVLDRLRSCPGKDIDRQRQLQTYFEQAGCTGAVLTLDQPKHSSFGNVVCTLPGTSEQQMNMDTMGLGQTNAWVSHADPNLAKLAFALASAMKLPPSGVNVENVGSTDSESFREKKVPSIAFSSITQATLPILHTIKDQLSQIKEDDYYESYKFLSAYLVYLDSAVPGPGSQCEYRPLKGLARLSQPLVTANSR
jgi:hypothetical protein